MNKTFEITKLLRLFFDFVKIAGISGVGFDKMLSFHWRIHTVNFISEVCFLERKIRDNFNASDGGFLYPHPELKSNHQAMPYLNNNYVQAFRPIWAIFFNANENDQIHPANVAWEPIFLILWQNGHAFPYALNSAQNTPAHTYRRDYEQTKMRCKCKTKSFIMLKMSDSFFPIYQHIQMFRFKNQIQENYRCIIS